MTTAVYSLGSRSCRHPGEAISKAARAHVWFSSPDLLAKLALSPKLSFCDSVKALKNHKWQLSTNIMTRYLLKTGWKNAIQKVWLCARMVQALTGGSPVTMPLGPSGLFFLP